MIPVRMLRDTVPRSGTIHQGIHPIAIIENSVVFCIITIILVLCCPPLFDEDQRIRNWNNPCRLFPKQ
jgi:hypothetical protein